MSVLSKLKSVYWSAMADRRIVDVRKTQLQAMRAAEDPGGRLLAESITDVIENRFTRSERAHFSRIENLRARLAAADEEVVTLDFGAGEPDEHLSKREMDPGRAVTLRMSRLCMHSSQRHPWPQLMFAIVRRMAPEVSLELGTCIGMSGSYIAAGHEIADAGRLVTLEGSETLAGIAGRNFAELGLKRVEIVLGRFQDTLAGTLARRPGIGFAFVDGHHDGDATMAYFDAIVRTCPSGSVILFDDIKWYESMQRAWQKIADDERVRTVVDLEMMGIVVTGPAPGPKNRYAFRIR